MGPSSTASALPGRRVATLESDLDGASSPLAEEKGVKAGGALLSTVRMKAGSIRDGDNAPGAAELLETPSSGSSLVPALPAPSDLGPVRDLDSVLAEMGAKLQSLEDQVRGVSETVQQSKTH